MDKNRFFILVTKSQIEELSKGEKHELENFISTNQDLEKEAEFVSNFWSKSEFTVEANGDRVYEALSQEINSKPEFKTKVLVMWPRVAAAIAFLLVFGAAAIFMVRQFQFTGDSILAEAQVTQVEKNAPLGKKLRTSLPDGSIVWLNSGSKLIFPSEFLSDSRTVELQGEGYFEVERDEKRPFQVKTKDIVTTALGTSFNIRSYAEASNVQISLATGKVKVDQYSSDNHINNTYYLLPGQEIKYAKDIHPVVAKYNWDEVFGWRDELIYFKNANKQEVIEKLVQWYGVEIDVEDKNPELWDVTAKFRSQSLENVLKNISFTVGFEYSINGEKVSLKFKQ